MPVDLKSTLYFFSHFGIGIERALLRRDPTTFLSHWSQAGIIAEPLKNGPAGQPNCRICGYAMVLFGGSDNHQGVTCSYLGFHELIKDAARRQRLQDWLKSLRRADNRKVEEIGAGEPHLPTRDTELIL